MAKHNGNSNNGHATSLRLKTGLAEMLKGGVIMDVTDAKQAEIAEKAGAVAVMALSASPHRFALKAVSLDGVAQKDPRDYGHSVDSRDGEVPHRTFCRGADT